MGDKKPNLLGAPRSRHFSSLINFDRAILEFWQGRPVAIRDASGKALIALACDGLNPENLHKLKQISGGTRSLVITARRAAVLGLDQSRDKVLTLTTDPPLTLETAF